MFGDIAVDDISLASGACGGMNLGISSTSENFKIDAYFFKFEQILSEFFKKSRHIEETAFYILGKILR